jgi:hypothetical protein
MLLAAVVAAGCGGSDSADGSGKPRADASTADAGSDAAQDATVASSDAAADVAAVEEGGPVSDAAPLTPKPGVWTYYDVPGTMCLNGSTAGFGVITNPASKDLMIYLEGGGACFSDACDFTAFSVPFIPPPDGIFNRNRAENPVRDWNVVYVPYCTGDIHAGDNQLTLGGQLRQFRGYTNIAKYLSIWLATFPDVERVLLSGISAGGFGAGLNLEQVIEGLGPGRQYILIDDSGPPLSKAAMPPCLQAAFKQVWALDKTFLASCGSDCQSPDDFARDWIKHVISKYPTVRAGVFSNTRDAVIRAFMGAGWGNGQYDNCDGILTSVPGSVYEQDLLALRGAFASKIGTYYVGPTQILYGAGLWHTVLRSPTYYTTNVEGVRVTEWLSGVIAGKVQHVGP